MLKEGGEGQEDENRNSNAEVEGSQFRIWGEASLRRLTLHVRSPRGQDRIKQRWNPADLEARTALLRLI